MRKKLLSLALALVMCLGLAVPALAADSDFVIENGVLTKYNGPGGDVVVPAGVTAIGRGVFSYKYNLTSVTLPEGLTTIGLQAFRDSPLLTTVTLPDSLTTIGEQAFYSCSKLTGLTIPNGVKTIGSSAFEYCTSLTSITIPNSVTSIGTHEFSRNVFENCDNLTGIHVSPGNQSFTERGGVLFSKDMTCLICCPGGKQGSYVIPNGVTTIEYAAIGGCEKLKGVTIPNIVTTIEWAAFCYWAA